MMMPPQQGTGFIEWFWCITEKTVAWTTTPRSADFQSAVSPISNRQIVRNFGPGQIVFRPARWKRAIQQIGNLRYGPASVSVAYPEHWSVTEAEVSRWGC